jgi:hypothetical protein
MKLISKILILGCFVCGCGSQTQRVPTEIPTVDLMPLTSGILISEFTWKINEPEKAGAFLADVAKMQVDKLMLSTKR